MQTILGLIVTLSLTGCFQRINITEIKQAQKFCEDKLGVLEIIEYAGGLTKVYCVSGDSAIASNVSLIDDVSSEVK